MVNIEIDGQIYSVDESNNLLQACLSLGLDLPYFCWHPAMGSVGACRQCALIQYEDSHDLQKTDLHDQRGRIVMGCMTPVSEGMRISINDKRAQGFRARVIEYLMTNHPHDCPVCEEGGECHLQDMTLMSGHTERKYRGTKRTHRNQYLGPFINHEMNRCIACYRCVRYYRDYAGGHDLQVMAAHSHVYFGRHEEGVLESEFSGNLVEVCPTGVFTDKTLSEHYSRKWDLQAAPSICVHCAQGCNTSPGERYGELRRIVNRYHGQVNGYFLCDRGRFGYGFVNGRDRITHALNFHTMEQDERQQIALTRAETRDQLLQLIGKDKRLLGIGSPRTSLEANFALRELVGAQNFYSGMSEDEAALHQLALETLTTCPVRIPTLKQVEQADAVLVLGEDVLNTSPRLALSLRQTAANIGAQIARQMRVPIWQDAAVREARQDKMTPIYLLTLMATGIDDIAADTYSGTPDKIAQLGAAIAHAIDSSAPLAGTLSEAEAALAQTIASTLTAASHPLIISGTGSLSSSVMQAAANIATALASINNTESRQQPDEEQEHVSRSDPVTDLLLCLPESNSMGVTLLHDERQQGGSLKQAVQRIEGGEIDTLVVLENDLNRRLPGDLVERLFSGPAQIIVLDHTLHNTATRADMLLPAGVFAEIEGTLVSSEGRAQRYYPVYVPSEDIRASWEWLSDMIALRNESSQPPWLHVDEVTQSCGSAVPALRAIIDAAPSDDFTIQGMKVPRQPHRYSGRTAMLAGVNVCEPKQPEDADSPLAFSMEGYVGAEMDVRPASITPFYWSPGWNSNQAVGKFQQEINGPLKGGDPGVRLIEAPSNQMIKWYEISLPAAAGTGQWLLLPQYHIFLSEELSSRSATIGARSPVPCVVIHPDDAAALLVSDGDGLEISASDRTLHLEVKLDAHCPLSAVCVPSGVPQTLGLEYLQRVTLCKDFAWQPRPRASLIATDKEARS